MSQQLMATLHKSMVPGRTRGLLGRKPPDPSVRMLNLSHYFDLRSLPPAPTSADYITKISDWGMLLNDQLGCCVPTGAAHAEMIFSLYGTGTLDAPTDNDVLRAYEAVGGYKPGNPQTDQGCMLTDMLKWWMTNKMSHSPISAWASISNGDTNAARLGIFWFGGAYVGISLSQRDLDDFDRGRIWSDTRPGDPDKGHCVLGAAFTPSGPVVITWGHAQQCTWDWWHYRVGAPQGEAYAVISPFWLANKTAPPGLEVDLLLKDFTVLTGYPAPKPPDPGPIVPPNPPLGVKTFSFEYDMASGKAGPVSVK